jgi:hypothetical protein
MQPHSIRIKLCDQPLDAFDLRWVSRRTQQLALALNPFVYFYARLAHARTPPAFHMPNADRWLWFQKGPALIFKRDQRLRKGASTCHLGQAFVICISSDAEKLLDTIASDWRDDPKLGQMSTDGVDHRGLLADEQVTGVRRRRDVCFWPVTASMANGRRGSFVG